ncbi:MAG: holo-ACP synthase [Gammaproteobacteria bacterium]
MIVGIGTDIMGIERMQESLQQRGDAYARRLLTESEFAEYEKRGNKAAFLAKRFAAKEAAVKALGTGFADSITWKQVNIHNDDKGAPVLTFTGKALERAQLLGVTDVHLSISDEKHYAVAFVILEQRIKDAIL